ncbi:unnamed protein product [Pseudo-nitzschia multistriata]|uniref:Uncharacterized protein n=1 Tax=Pseudo-nitzschia multistriata TaxID=183589 RepID=A0A448ZHE6_9STRA|nr:unnamed protein product [Pseudo-nitzschia multistriata]
MVVVPSKHTQCVVGLEIDSFSNGHRCPPAEATANLTLGLGFGGLFRDYPNRKEKQTPSFYSTSNGCRIRVAILGKTSRSIFF